MTAQQLPMIRSARWITALFLGFGMVDWAAQAATTNGVWRTGGKVYSSPAIGSDGTIYVGSYDGNLYAFNLNGQTNRAWITGGAIQSSPAIGDDNTLYVGSMDSNLYAFALDGTTSHVWRTGGSIISSPAIGTNGNIYVGSMDWNLYEFLPNGTTGHIWRTGYSIESSPALHPVGSNTYIYVASYDGALYQFLPDGSTGQIWETYSWIRASPVIHSNGKIYVGSLDDGLYECDPSTNLPAKNIWPGNIASSVAILTDSNLCFGTQCGYFEIITTSGVEVNRFFLGGEINSSPAIGSDGTIYVGNSSGILYAVSSPSSSIALLQTAGPVNSSPAIWDGLICVGSDDGNCYSIDDGLNNAVAYTDWPKFRHHNRNIGRSLYLEKGLAPTNGYIVSTPAIGANRDVYVGSSEGALYAVTQNGSIRHTWHTAGAITSSAAIGSNDNIYVGSCDSNLYEFLPDGTTGNIWKTGGQIWTTPAIGSNGVLYVGACDSKFYAFALDGTTSHIWNVGSKIDYSSAAIAQNGTIYVGCYDGDLYGFNPDGTTSHVWSTRANIRAPPAIDGDGTIYVGSMDDVFYSFNPNGTTNWYINVNANIRGGAVIDANGTIYVGADQYVTNGTVNRGCVYAFGRDGSTKYVWRTNGKVRTSPAIGLDGTVYFLSDNEDSCKPELWAVANEETPRRARLPISSFEDYSSVAISPDQTILFTAGTNLYRFNSTGGQLATAPWPKFQYDTRNSGWNTNSGPEQITGLNASDGTYTDRVALVWEASTNASGYQIYRSTENNSTSAILIGATTSTTYDDTTAVVETTYYYWVKSTNSAGSSDFSSYAVGWRAQAGPAGVSASDGIYVDKVRVSWCSATNATGYQVWRYTADISSSASQIGTTTTNAYDDTSAVIETTYYYWVKATNSFGTSGFSFYDTGWRGVSSVSTNRRVLLVGIDNYSPAYGPSSLETCTNDAVGIRDIFLLGDPSNHWSSTNMILYTDQQATKTTIQNALHSLAAASGAGDLAVYVHSSHGGTSGGSNTFICTYDASFTDAELAADLALFPTDTKVIIILDTCYSGGMFKSDGTPEVEWLFAERVMEHYHNIQQVRFKSLGKAVPKTLGQNIAFMTACDYDEYSYCSDFYSRYIGYLIQGCNVQSVDTNANGQLSFLELHNYAATNAMAEAPTQHAQSFNASLLDSTIARAVGINPGVVTHIMYNDFDGDGASDMAAFNPNTGHWRIASLKRWMLLACDNFAWGTPGFKPFDGDYDGDRASDLNIYNTQTGEWRIGSLKRGAVLLPSAFFGGPGLTPVSGDYNGDKISDAALYGQPDGYWYIITASTGIQLVWGASYTGIGFIPVSGDFDGDRINDLAMYHVNSGYWYIGSLTQGIIVWGIGCGDASMVPVSGDYDGDGYSDLALYQPTTGNWYIASLRRRAIIANGVKLGGPGYIPVPGDYDGDRYDDLAVYQPATGYWLFHNLKVNQSLSLEYPIGGPGYIPVLSTW